MTRVVRIVLKDALAIAGALAPAPYTCVLFCRVPADWLDGDGLREEKMEAIYAAMYGPRWRDGNDDGSQYVVRSVTTQVLGADEEEQAPWRAVTADDEHQYWFYDATGDGAQVRSVTAAEL